MTRLLVLFLFLGTSAFAQDPPEKALPAQLPDDFGIYDNDLLPATFHAARRQALRDSMPAGSVAVLLANPVRNRSNDVDFEYHQNPDFYYLTGLREPHAIVLVFKEEHLIGSERVDEVLFVQSRSVTDEVWTGKRLGIEGAKQVLEVEAVYTNDQFADFSFNWDKLDHIYYSEPHDDMRDNTRDKGDLASLRNHFERKTESLGDKLDKGKLKYWLATLRQLKLPEELILMRKAIDITCLAQAELMRAAEPNMREYEAEALVEYFFKAMGAEYPGFPSICGSGENGCILHYTTNRKKVKPNNLLVVDIGAEYHGYTADVTRTIPADGDYSEEEAAIYNIVLEAQQAGIEACLPGNKFWEPNTAATAVISRGLRELGIINKSYEVRKYFMHGTSHYLGLDVHDAGLFGPLRPGNVITVEPGIYIAEGSDCDPKWWNIGVRIEDDILITDDGYENLSQSVPRTIPEIEALMQEESLFNLMRR